MPFARASELDRLMTCPGSGFLARSPEVPNTRRDRAAQWGNMCHFWKETGVLPDNEAWALPLHRKIKLSKIDRLAQWPEFGVHEVALAYNVVTGKAARCQVPIGAPGGGREYREHWKLAFSDEWVTGTLDYAAELLGVPWVDDLKTGRVVSIHDYEYQQAFYVLGWTLAEYGELRESRSTITHWPRYPLEGRPRRLGRVLDVGYLTTFRGELRKLRERILRGRKGAKVKLESGSHCTFCPSKEICPKMTSDEGQNQEML